jgi:hypothetical protein
LIEEALRAYLGPRPARGRKTRIKLPVFGNPSRKISHKEYLKIVKEMKDDDIWRFSGLQE